MLTWSEILKEIEVAIRSGDKSPMDTVRRKYLEKLQAHTKRDTILYATRFTQSGASDFPPEAMSIVDEDLQGLMEVVHGLKGPDLDLILHSPGGSPEAAEAIVSYLRSKFNDIRVIVPSLAMSAATMIACGADRIVMGKHSFLGPIDPQLLIQTQLGRQMAPAQAILDQFEQAKSECQDSKKLAAWLPMLGQYGPHVIQMCQNVLDLSKEVVKNWLSSYMFKKQDAQKANEIAEWLANHQTFKSHGRHISRDLAEEKGLVIEHLESDQNVQDLVLAVFHATTHTFSMTPCVKILENHRGRSFIKHVQVIAALQQNQQRKPA